LKIAILRETRAFERRVAATPETVKKFIGLGFELAVEAGAGAGASITDAAYSEAGARVADRAATLSGAGMIFAVQGPEANELADFGTGAVLIAGINPYQRKDALAAYAGAGITAMAMELMPRITRAQSMDILSSQSNLSGYKAVLDAATEYGGAFPMMMTAAGTISAAKAFVMGVGVAGLQAIATARRLGAVVSATDVRAATKEQIESLGAKAIFVTQVKGIEGEGTGGYATEMSDEYKRAQAELVSAHITKQDIVITTALIPGRAAPRLISAAQIATMKAGSVIVDLAVEQGGNVEGSVAGEVVTTANDVKIVGHRNVPSRLASDASALFARNLFNFVSAFYDKDTKSIKWDFEDELLKAVVVTKAGSITRDELRGA
jgi:H+-translocating NAD(P) transhydrogenase subunit alpha